MFLASAAMGSAQFRLVKDVNPGLNESIPSGFYVFNNRLFFSANYFNGSVGVRRVYVTDGTNVGTIPIEFNSAGSGNYVLSAASNTSFLEYNNELILDSKSSGNQVYIVKILGSNNYTESPGLESLSTKTGSPNSRFINATVFNDKIIYNPWVAGSPSFIEPFVIDLQNSANTGLLFNINTAGGGDSNPRYFTALSSGVLFSAYNPTYGYELWKTDGTAAGTALFNDINTGGADSNPNEFNLLGTQLTFVATHPTLGRELFKTNGNTGSLVLVKDINTSGDSNPQNVKEINGVLYFSADNGTVGQELWKSNGLNAGTVLVKDINPSGDALPSNFTQVGSTTIYFVADDGVNGRELWKTDGTSAGTVMVKDINPSGNSNIRNLIEYNGKLYFTANNGTNGDELWVSDGTSVGTLLLELNPTDTAQYTSMIVFNNELFFGAVATPYTTGGKGIELYAYKDPALAANNFELAGNAIKLYPNPAKSHFELATTANVEKVEVYSLQGQLVKTFANQNQYEINDLAKGMYIVKISAQEGVANKTLVIE